MKKFDVDTTATAPAPMSMGKKIGIGLLGVAAIGGTGYLLGRRSGRKQAPAAQPQQVVVV